MRIAELKWHNWVSILIPVVSLLLVGLERYIDWAYTRYTSGVYIRLETIEGNIKRMQSTIEMKVSEADKYHTRHEDRLTRLERRLHAEEIRSRHIDDLSGIAPVLRSKSQRKENDDSR